jgi:hypothetical protein
MKDCACSEEHPSRRIVLTGGPGAGKTAVLEMMRKTLCKHVVVVPEAAGVVFGGGFPRLQSVEARRAGQRAIFFMAENVSIALCDRGTIDGLAYWPGPDDLWVAVGTTLDEQLARYHAVIHLRTPPVERGYNHENPLRIESAIEAAAIDARIAEAWARHPRRFEVPASDDFIAKVAHVVELVRGELPACCRKHPVAELGEEPWQWTFDSSPRCCACGRGSAGTSNGRATRSARTKTKHLRRSARMRFSIHASISATSAASRTHRCMSCLSSPSMT